MGVDTGGTNAGCRRYLKEKNPAVQVYVGGKEVPPTSPTFLLRPRQQQQHAPQRTRQI